MSNSVIPGNNYEMVAKVSGDIENGTLAGSSKNSWKATGRHSISWNNLSWEVDVKKVGGVATKKLILDNASGYVDSGSVSIFEIMWMINSQLHAFSDFGDHGSKWQWKDVTVRHSSRSRRNWSHHWRNSARWEAPHSKICDKLRRTRRLSVGSIHNQRNFDVSVKSCLLSVDDFHILGTLRQ